MMFWGKSRFGNMSNWREENSGSAKNDAAGTGNKDAVNILKLRLAKGEINHEEYNKLLEKILKD
jgi:uncharacterized membrane protein